MPQESLNVSTHTSTFQCGQSQPEGLPAMTTDHFQQIKENLHEFVDVLLYNWFTRLILMCIFHSRVTFHMHTFVESFKISKNRLCVEA